MLLLETDHVKKSELRPNFFEISDRIKRAFKNAIRFQLIEKRPGPRKFGYLNHGSEYRISLQLVLGGMRR